MFKSLRTFLFASLSILLIFSSCSPSLPDEKKAVNNPKVPGISPIELSYASQGPLETYSQTVIKELSTEKRQISNEDVELIALLTMAEAEGECEKGKRLVIDTIFNRVDSEHFPDTVYDVVYQPYQFTPMWNGRVDRCEVRDDICELVMEEFESRTNNDVIFFTTGGYSKYGAPMFQVGNHYFSSYD